MRFFSEDIQCLSARTCRAPHANFFVATHGNGSGSEAVLAPADQERVMKEHPEVQPIVFVVDDDVSLREALKNLLRSIGIRVEVFGSAAAFLKYKVSDAAACLVLDIRLPGVS